MCYQVSFSLVFFLFSIPHRPKIRLQTVTQLPCVSLAHTLSLPHVHTRPYQWYQDFSCVFSPFPAQTHTAHTFPAFHPVFLLHDASANSHSPLFFLLSIAVDDPRKVVKVVASDGKSGDTRDISYTNCKVIGNGSFGVVFQARLTGGPQDNTDIAIKKVLQDKRFKVRFRPTSIISQSSPLRHSCFSIRIES